MGLAMYLLPFVLKANGINYKEVPAGFLFPICPNCKGERSAQIEDGEFFCSICQIKPASLSDFASLIKIEIPELETDLGKRMAIDADRMFEKTRTSGLTTGYSKLDELLGGGFKGQRVYVIAAETGVGKSAFSTNLLVNLFVHTDINSTYFDLENGKENNFERTTYILGDKSPAFFHSPSNKDDFLSITESTKGRIQYLDNLQLAAVFGRAEGIKKAEILCDLIKRDVQNRNTKVFVIDPLGEFETVGSNSAGSAFANMQKVMMEFNKISKQLDISLILLHHLKKPGSQNNLSVKSLDEVTEPRYRIPTLSDFIGTSWIPNYATDCWALVRQISATSKYEQGKTLLRILKKRGEGMLGDVKFQMDVDTLKCREFEEIKVQGDWRPYADR